MWYIFVNQAKSGLICKKWGELGYILKTSYDQNNKCLKQHMLKTTYAQKNIWGI